MPKKPGTNPKGEFAFFNVVYEDDTQRSNRRVPAELLGGLEGDEPARGYIMEQDREIAEKSGRPTLAIKSLSRVGVKKKWSPVSKGKAGIHSPNAASLRAQRSNPEPSRDSGLLRRKRASQ